jgi:hypothetical protein
MHVESEVKEIKQYIMSVSLKAKDNKEMLRPTAL